MQFARKLDVGSKTAPQKPIVAVISKTSLDPLEIPSGILDCSGTRNATNPEFIHGEIWAEAKRRGITKPEPWYKPEYNYRQRLEPYQSDLPKLIRQWESFSETVKETLLMTRSIPASKITDETAIIHKIINALEPHEDVKDFSFEQVNDIFSEVGKAHRAAKTPPESEIKTLIRNILHGKIEQFSAVTNHIDFARKVFEEISTALISLPQFSEIGIRIKRTLDDFSEKEPLIPFLRSLENDTDLALNELPNIEERVPPPIPIPPVVKKKINIIVVEDNKVWTEIILSAIEKVKSRLGKKFEISFNHFDNVDDALKAVPKKENTTFSDTAEQDEPKTIAIVDICLPANNKQPYQIPDKKHGEELLKNLLEYNASVPTIVFSTKSSLEDIRDIGKFGISDENFLSKEDSDPEQSIVQSLIALVEKKQKYFIRRHERDSDGKTYYAFSINGICIPFSKELNATFQALFELAEGDIENKTQFTAKEIYIRKLQIGGKRKFRLSESEKKSLQSQINKIREFIHDTFQENNCDINVKDLVKTIEKESEEFLYELNKENYIIHRHEKVKKGTVYYEFSINGICIPFSKELNATFQALFELAEGDIENKTQFTAKEIYIRKLQIGGKHEKKSLQSQINEIREFIHDTFRKNSRYIDVRDLIKTEEDSYKLNAEFPSFEDEENFEEDYEIFKNKNYNVLVIEKNEDHRNQIVNALKSISNTVKVINSFDRNFTQTVFDFRPDIVCVDLQQVECWKNIRSILPYERLGIIVTTTNNEPNKKRLVGTALKSGIPNTNFVSTNEEAWINSFLTILNYEKRRVFLGEVVDCLQNFEVNEPIVEVLAGSDLSNGVLKLQVNGEFFTMNKSNISKIIGLLLLNSRTLIPLETIKQKAVGSLKPVTEDDQKGWTRKIRNKIEGEWLKTKDRKLAMKILNSSEKGMRLNVQAIYPQTD